MSSKYVGEDLVAEKLGRIRHELNSPTDWPELEPLIYDTLKDFEALPELSLGLEIPGAERMTNEEKKVLGVALAERFVDYGLACRKELITELVKARIELFRLKKSTE